MSDDDIYLLSVYKHIKSYDLKFYMWGDLNELVWTPIRTYDSNNHTPQHLKISTF